MKPTKVRYVLRNGRYIRKPISNAGTYLNKRLSSVLPESSNVYELIPVLVKNITGMNVVIYELNSRYLDSYGVPGIVEAVVG